MSRIPGLDLLRAIAIAWVMLYHAQVMAVMPDDNPIANFGWMGVDLFFALSGFLIGGQLFAPMARGEPSQTGRFYLRRLFRTIPAYLAVVVLYFTWHGFRERPQIQPLWQFLTFTENLFIDFSHPKAFSHVWSLCVEEQFYLVAPLAAWLLLSRPAAWKAVAACAGLLIGGMALRGWIWTSELAALQGVSGPDGFWRHYQEHIYYPTWTRLDGLLGGVVLALTKAFRPAWWARIMAHAKLVLALGLAALAGAIAMFLDQATFLATVFGFPVLAFAMACLVASGAGRSGLIGRFAIPGAGALAAGAYSLYLTHKQVYHLIHVAVGDGLDHRPVLAVLVYAAAALAAGAALYWLVERPFLRLRDRLVSRTRVAPEQAHSPAEAA